MMVYTQRIVVGATVFMLCTEMLLVVHRDKTGALKEIISVEVEAGALTRKSVYN